MPIKVLVRQYLPTILLGENHSYSRLGRIGDASTGIILPREQGFGIAWEPPSEFRFFWATPGPHPVGIDLVAERTDRQL